MSTNTPNKLKKNELPFQINKGEFLAVRTIALALGVSKVTATKLMEQHGVQRVRTASGIHKYLRSSTVPVLEKINDEVQASIAAATKKGKAK